MDFLVNSESAREILGLEAGARGSEAWLEIAPPRSDRRVRLEGKVVWTRGFGPNDVATIPPGFGVQVTGGSVGDLERFTRGYHAFAAELSA